MPAFVLLAAVGLERLRPGWNGRGAVLAGLLVLSTSGIVLYHTVVKKEEWRDATRYVLERARPGDALLFYPPYVRRPFDYYAGRLGAGPTAPDIVFPPPDYTLDRPDTALMAGLPEGHARVWLVLSHVGEGEDREVASWLDGSLTGEYSEPLARRFRGLRVLLYERPRAGFDQVRSHPREAADPP
jgi:hypothetical protein